MAESIEILSLRQGQQGQILEQYRSGAYNSDLRFTLLLKMLEEKGVMAKGEFDTRWPLYLKNDVGVVGPDGQMEGSLRVTFFGEKK